MINSYFKIAFRNFLKYKGYSFINILGLATGITCCLLILLFVQDELSYDKYNEKAERIYRIAVNGLVGTTEFNSAVSPTPLAETLLSDYPEVETAVRIRSFGYPVVRYKDKVFSEERFYWMDSTFFKVFTAEFIKGDPDKALIEPRDVVITESMMKKYFEDEDPIGKILNLNNVQDYQVSGVIKDFPENSHFHFDFLASIVNSRSSKRTEWLINDWYTYIVLQKGIDALDFEKKLEEVVNKFVSPELTAAMGIPYKDLLFKGGRYKYYLQALTDIHLKSNLEHEIEPNSSISYVYIFTVIAFSILFIACINFTNLSTARSSNRSKEFGIRKTLGSKRKQLIWQFLIETIVMSFIALLFSILLIELLLPSFNNLVGKHIELDYLQFYFIPVLALIGLLVGIFAGIYPAFYLSSFNPIKIFRRETVKSSKSWLRNSLVITQFTISIILFIGTIIVYSQLQFMQNKKLGYAKEQILVIQKTDDIASNKESFMEDLKNIPGVVSASNSHTIFGKEFGSTAYKLSGSKENDESFYWTMYADYNFAETYRIRMAEGRFYSKEFGTDSLAVVINEAAAKNLGIKGNAIGKEIYPINRPGLKKHIIGVMKDFHFESLHQQIKPFIIDLYPSQYSRGNIPPNLSRYVAPGFGRYVSVRLTPEDYGKKIESVKEVWHKFAGKQSFEFFFFDQEFAKIYRAEERTRIIASVFSGLAIFIACLGLLGLAAFIIEQRTKEVGIRKILGAKISSIILLLSKEFIKWVLIANLIAFPLAYFIMNKWLEDFAYRINVPLWSFLVAGFGAFIIALMTVSYMAIKAATANPVEALRYE